MALVQLARLDATSLPQESELAFHLMRLIDGTDIGRFAAGVGDEGMLAPRNTSVESFYKPQAYASGL